MRGMTEQHRPTSSIEIDFSRNQIAELVKKYGDKVVTRQQRDEWLRATLIPIAGCTSVSLPFLFECLSALEPAILPYSIPGKNLKNQVYIEVTESVFADLAPVEHAQTLFFDVTDTADLFRDNEVYGELWAKYTLLRALGCSDEALNDHETNDILIHYSDQLFAALDIMPKSRTKWQQRAIELAVRVLSRHHASLRDYKYLAEHTKGIQILYVDSPESRQFFREQLHAVVDDAALELQVPIPLEYVVGFVPLGEYEERVLKCY